LVAHQIPFQVVPGITAAAGVSAYAGIALTHRDYAQSVQFVTGHCRKEGQEPNWSSMAQANHTLVVYMGLMKAAHIQQQLIDAGRDAQTPVAIVENGTRPNQRIVTGELAQLAELVASHHVQSPALVIIGEVVKLQSTLHWFGAHADSGVFAQPLTQVDSAYRAA